MGSGTTKAVRMAILNIMENSAKVKDAAARYGVHTSTIYRHAQYKAWKLAQEKGADHA